MIDWLTMSLSTEVASLDNIALTGISNPRPGNMELPWLGFEPQTWKRGIALDWDSNPRPGNVELPRLGIRTPDLETWNLIVEQWNCYRTRCSNGCLLGGLLVPRQDNHVQRCMTLGSRAVRCKKWNCLTFRHFFLPVSHIKFFPSYPRRIWTCVTAPVCSKYVYVPLFFADPPGPFAPNGKTRANSEENKGKKKDTQARSPPTTTHDHKKRPNSVPERVALIFPYAASGVTFCAGEKRSLIFSRGGRIAIAFFITTPKSLALQLIN